MEKMEPQLNAPLGNAQTIWAGAVAGAMVDLTLYPLDTIKTRLQSQQGFKAAGGFRKIYAGVPAVGVGSAPSAALFFVSYEKTKRILDRVLPHPTYAHMIAAGVGEMSACLIRVPTEIIKQRAQASPSTSTLRLIIHTFVNDGLSGFFRGYWITVGRELPFSFIEFPLWEFLRRYWSEKQGGPVSALQTAACGSVSGAVAAGLTTPLDVAKTRIMLSRKVTGERMSIKSVLTDIYRVKGFKGLFAGFWPRVVWMSLGGFVFFGAYDKAVRIFNAAEPIESPERTSIMRYQAWLQRIMFTIFDAFFDSEAIKKGNTRTFEDALREAEEIDTQRRIAATMKKSEKGPIQKFFFGE